jgi:hypothetical protein
MAGSGETGVVAFAPTYRKAGDPGVIRTRGLRFRKYMLELTIASHAITFQQKA